jgi:NAD(P)-dependent dehydrogenase (short-subunit alcohol dehydrogenase family)
MSRPLSDRVCLVAGATRGAGRGIARMLGEAGATVYCTGRSVRGRPASGAQRPETIEETAELVTAEGGVGIAVRVDHRVDDEVRALAERVRRDHGALDVLVNDVWGGDALTRWGAPFWELDSRDAAAMLQTAVHTHLVTSRHLVPLMVERGRGLVVEITDGDDLRYRGNLHYDLAKTAVARLALAMAEELMPHGVTALAVTPGFLRSEEVLDHFGVTEARWRDAIAQDPHFAASETPCFVGRAVAALAADPHVHARTGGVYASWTLAEEYGFVDADGARPYWGRHFAEHVHLEPGTPGGPQRSAWRWELRRVDGGSGDAPRRTTTEERGTPSPA